MVDDGGGRVVGVGVGQGALWRSSFFPFSALLVVPWRAWLPQPINWSKQNSTPADWPR